MTEQQPQSERDELADLRAEVEALRAEVSHRSSMTLHQQRRAEKAEADVASWDEHLRAFSQWIDEGTTLGPEAQVWHRVSKVAEEAGEAVAALLGYTGANPRKGYTHTLDQVDAELMQTALSALGASAHLHAGDPTYSPFRRLRLQLARDMHRVGLDAVEPADQPHPTPEAGL